MNENPVFEQIEKLVQNNDIVLFMKGTKKIPQCGFSSTVVHIMERLGVDFVDVNVLADQNIREGIKQFSNWPTVPQIYVKGEFIGGCDIAKEMYQSGELQQLLQEKAILKSAM